MVDSAYICNSTIHNEGRKDSLLQKRGKGKASDALTNEREETVGSVGVAVPRARRKVERRGVADERWDLQEGIVERRDMREERDDWV